MDYKSLITDIKNFPIEGVNFKDISPLLASPQFDEVILKMGELVEKPDYWVGIESRGFIFASALSMKFGGGVILCRKAGKLPGKIITETYVTEYSKDELSIQLGTGKVIIVDDVLATGGTLSTVNSLCISAGYDVRGSLVLIDLRYVPRSSEFINITSPFIKSLIQYE